jgi:hypothetical protein
MNCHHIDAPNLRAAVPIRHFVGAEQRRAARHLDAAQSGAKYCTVTR